MDAKRLCRRNDIDNDNDNDNDNDKDIISDLPDCLLKQILSNLDIKLAIQTSLVSRRWRHLWPYVPSLKFFFLGDDYKLPYGIKGLIGVLPRPKGVEIIESFVNNVFSRRGACEIDKFEFRCDLPLDTHFLDSMMSRVMSLKAKEVEIQVIADQSTGINLKGCIYYGPIWQLPECLYENKSLEKLELGVQFFIPSRKISLRTLKELRLHGVSCEWVCGPTASMKEAVLQEFLTSQCPVLESLSLSDCYFPTFKLEISSPMLKYLGIFDSDFNQVVVSSPLLTHFKFEDDGVLNLSIDDRCLLEEVDINIKFVKVGGATVGQANMLLNFLKQFEKAKSVAISWKTLMVLSAAGDALEGMSPPFPNLKNFKLKVAVQEYGNALKYLLSNSTSDVKTTVEVPNLRRYCSFGRRQDV